jgi:hypothetical protein
MRTTLVLTLGLALAACGDEGTPATPDAAIDAAIDAPALLALDCTTYCTHLATDCPPTGATAQITMANCMGTCAAFPPGAQADTSGNTLGCRNYHLQNIEVRGQAAATHCPHAGPVGGLLSAATGVCSASPCETFCNLDTKVCGTDAAPVMVEGMPVTNRYATTAACTTACAAFATTPEYSPTAPNANTFACRFYHLTNAAAQTTFAGRNAHCGHTLSPAAAVCL